ncbi:MAG: hypothetical protein V4736_02320 [Bdellovibrionota bacterium]
MSEFVTVPRYSAEGQKYLLGKSREFRYLPIKNENPGQPGEQVTFQVIPVKPLNSAEKKSLLGQLFKWRKLVFVLFPFVRLLVITEPGALDLGIFWLSFLASICLFLGTSWQSDYLDHLRGYDLLAPTSADGKNEDMKILAKGWLSASSLYQASWAVLIAGALMGLYLILIRPGLIVVAVVVAALLLILFFSKGRAYKQRGWFDFGLIAIVGPLFAGGVEYALFGTLSPDELLFGLIWGMLFLFSHSVQSFPKVAQLAQYHIEPWLFLKDFDKNKKYFPLFWVLILSLYSIHGILNGRTLMVIVNIGIVAFFTWKWIQSLNRMASPVGSEIKRVSEQGHHLVLMFIFMWLLELIFSDIIRVVLKVI